MRTPHGLPASWMTIPRGDQDAAISCSHWGMFEEPEYVLQEYELPKHGGIISYGVISSLDWGKFHLDAAVSEVTKLNG